ncbi:hypothetical protein BGZ63DRAFT_401294 [Mariannaea sp. PMI_226]|nr:hypothetical protein BGZ63DRAFT_401294 [Mariannaea sp. PMI_226]
MMSSPLDDAIFREPEEMRTWALEALRFVPFLPEGLLLDEDVVLTYGNDFDFQYNENPTDEDFYNVQWTVMENNIAMVIGALSRYSDARMMHCRETRQTGRVLNTMAFDERLEATEEPMTLLEASALIQSFPVVRWSELWDAMVRFSVGNAP